MKELKGESTVSWRWWRGDGRPITKKAVDTLVEEAMGRAHYLLTDGYSSGELYAEVNGVEYTGWWEVKETLDK